MAAKKTAKKTSPKKTSPRKPVNKSKFVRSLPASTPGAEVVKKAKAAGITISLAYVYGIRSKGKAKRRSARATKSGSAGTPAVIAATGNGTTMNGSPGSSGGLEAAIEKIVEAKVTELLKTRLGALFG